MHNSYLVGHSVSGYELFLKMVYGKTTLSNNKIIIAAHHGTVANKTTAIANTNNVFAISMLYLLENYKVLGIYSAASGLFRV